MSEQQHPTQSVKALVYQCLLSLPYSLLAYALLYDMSLRWLAFLPPVAPLIGLLAARAATGRPPGLQLTLTPQGFEARGHPAGELARKLYDRCVWTLHVPFFLAMLYVAIAAITADDFREDLRGLLIMVLILAVFAGAAWWLHRRTKTAKVFTAGAEHEVFCWLPQSRVSMLEHSPGVWHVRARLHPDTKILQLEEDREASLDVRMPESKALHIAEQLKAWGVTCELSHTRAAMIADWASPRTG